MSEPRHTDDPAHCIVCWPKWRLAGEEVSPQVRSPSTLREEHNRQLRMRDAAPELYAALKKFADIIHSEGWSKDCGCGDCRLKVEIFAALAKARGET